MKKLLALALIGSLLLLQGCTTVADLLKPEPEDVEHEKTITDIIKEEKQAGESETEKEDLRKKIPLSKTLKMTNEWSIMGDFEFGVRSSEQTDRIVLATSAQYENGEMLWDDAQYWTLAVITEDGAYNLYYERISGVVYVEVNEAYINGMSTPVITAYIFSGNDREIRNYVYNSEEDMFVEDQLFTTKTFSTGGINNYYTSIPECKAR